jgi:putative serine protease PepD
MTDTMIRPQSCDHDHPPLSPGSVDPPVHVDPPTGGGRGGGGGWPRRAAGGVIVLALVAGGGTAGGALAERYLVDPGTRAAATSATTTATTALTEDANLAAIAGKVSPSIVTVLVDGAQESALGSGVVLGADGLILTNNHVVSADGTVSVRLSTGRTVPAAVVATDATHDLALVRATGLTGLTPVTFGTAGSVAVGDTVLAFGAPLGLSGTVTSGIVSALNRTVDTGTEKLTGLVQTDAAINEATPAARWSTRPVTSSASTWRSPRPAGRTPAVSASGSPSRPAR